MKLSKREKNLLLFLGIVVLLVGGFVFVVQPIHDNNEEAMQRYNTVQQQFNSTEARVKTEDEIASTISDYRDRLDKVYEQLPSQVYLEKIIHDVYTHFDEYDITLDSTVYELVPQESLTDLTTTDVVVEILNPTLSVSEILDRYEAGEDVSIYMEEEVIDEPETVGEIVEDLLMVDVGTMNVLINFRAGYDIMKEAIKGLEDVEGTIIAKNLVIRKEDFDIDSSDPDDNRVFVSLSISVPYYFDYEAYEDIIYDYQFEPNDGFEEHGPFEYIEIENYIGEVKGTGAVVSNLNPDFEVGVRNTSSDIAAQSLIYRNIGTSSIQLDSNTSERFTLDLIESNGQILFRYFNDVDSFPISDYQAMELNGNDIVVRVNSSSKANTGDNAGMTFVLNNNTTRRVVFYVFNDDSNDPRFDLLVNTGDFQIIRN